MTSLSSALDGVSTVRLSGNTSISSATCSSMLVASGDASGSSWRSTNDSNELVYSGRRSISPDSMATKYTSRLPMLGSMLMSAPAAPRAPA